MLALSLELPVKVAEMSLLEWKLIFLGLSSIFFDTKEERCSAVLTPGVRSLVTCLKSVVAVIRGYILKDSVSLAPANISWLY